MNSEDYKAIAEIIKEEFVCGYVQGVGPVHSPRCRKCITVNKLADYFEKSQEELLQVDPYPLNCDPFNPEQFRKWCGVTE